MHDCPQCGQACYCNGDIDDTYVLTEEWVYQNCDHDCDEDEEDYDYEWFDEDPGVCRCAISGNGEARKGGALMPELANPLPPATGDDVPGDLWMFVAAGQWQLLGAIEVTTRGIERWKERAVSDGIEISWEAGIQPGWSYVFPRNICPDDFLILLD